MSGKIKIRGGHRSQVTRIIDAADTAIANDPQNSNQLETYLTELKRQKDIIEALDNEILDTIEDKDIDNEVQETSDRMMKIAGCILRLEDMLSALSLTHNPANIPTPNPHTPVQNVKLPQLQLAKFDGDPLSWTNFWELFKTSVHDRTDLPAAAKFQYLNGQLEGAAAKLITGFSHTLEDYTEAVDLLQETYGQENVLIQARLNAILDLPSPEPNSTSLSKFRSSFEGHIRVLKASGSDIEQSGYVFAHILLRKLDSQTLENMNRANGNKLWTLENFRQHICAEIQHLSTLSDIQAQGSKVDSYSVNDMQYTSSFNMSNSEYCTSLASSNNRNIKPKILCKFCNSDHYSSECTKYVDVKSRKERASQLKLCYNCLNSNHLINACYSRNSCRHCGGNRHHTALCLQSKGSTTTSKQPSHSKVRSNYNNLPSSTNTHGSSSKEEKSSTNSVTVTNLSSSNSNVQVSLLPTADVSLVHGNMKQPCKALLDTGSMSTFVVRSVVSDLNLPISKKITLEVDGFDSVGEQKLYDVVNLTVCTSEGNVSMNAIVVENLANRITMPGRKQLLRELQTSALNLADKASYDHLERLHIIIGTDNIYKFLYGNKLKENLYEIPSKLGTIVLGTYEPKIVPAINCNVTTLLRVGVEHTFDDISKLWELDAIGIKDTCFDDDDALKKFHSGLSYVDGMYLADLPWKDDEIFLPSNKSMAYQRMQSVWKKLAKDQNKLSIYDGIIRDQLNRGFIELVDPTDCNFGNRTHYLPHHGVDKDSPTTPIRIVFDCSAKVPNSNSLNDCLLTGNSAINDIGALLLRFRLGNYAAVADIEKAYLAVGLNPSSRDSCRFFWPEDVFDPNSKILTYRFRRVLFGSTASQFLLNSTIKYHLSKYCNENAKKLLQDIYIDNILSTFQSKEALLKFYLDSKNLMSEGGFNFK